MGKEKSNSELNVQASCAEIMRVVTKAAALKLSQILDFVASECAKDVEAERERCAKELDELARICRNAKSTSERVHAYEAAAAHIRSLK